MDPSTSPETNWSALNSFSFHNSNFTETNLLAILIKKPNYLIVFLFFFSFFTKQCSIIENGTVGHPKTDKSLSNISFIEKDIEKGYGKSRLK